jgi:SsrA-binding protein
MNKEMTAVTNRQAFRDFHIEKAIEAGIQLKGDEVKSLRAGQANLKGSFAKFESGELFIYNLHISPYKFSREEENPLRPRKLLLHKRELHLLFTRSVQQGYAIIPLKIYFKRGFAKVEIALAKGKKLYDKRRAIKEREVKKDIDRALRLRQKS